jgi:heterodisulfide reductase subunit A
MEEQSEEIEVGSIILATGFEPFDCSPLLQYGYGRMPNVITGMEFEKMSNAGGPTGGKILLEDGMAPASVGILHCIGSRDENYNEYCSRVCCMYAMKFAHLVREKTHGEVYEFYIDVRAFGKGYEEFYKRCLREDVIFIRGKGAEVTDAWESTEEKGKLVIVCEDTLLGEVRRIPVDMVILATGLVPRRDAADVGRLFSVSRSKDGFFLELHPKLAPISTASEGIFLAGACQGPKDIPGSVAQGAAAAGAALSLSGAGVVYLEPITSVIDDKVCGGCKICISVCPYGAITFDDEKKVSVVTEVLCKGCGSCVSGCPSGAAWQRHFGDKQIFAEIDGALMEVS